jgi:hypothetical protein
MKKSLLLGFSVLLVACALAYLLMKAVFDRSDTVDFKYIWLAGDFWRSGLNPYGPDYVAAGERIFVGSNRPPFWPYPPNWWPIATATALWPYGISLRIWRVFSAFCLIGGSAILIRAMREAGHVLTPLRYAAYAVFVGASSATAITLSLGQTSALVFLGACCYAAAWISQSRGLMILALTLLFLKPPIGIVVAASLLAYPFWRTSLAVAAGLAVVTSLPALLAHDMASVLKSYLGILGTYTTHAVNLPESTTGLRNLLGSVVHIDVSPALLTLAGACVVALVCASIRSRSGPVNPERLVSLAIALTLFFVPLHPYDFIMVAPLVLLNARASLVAQALVGVGFLICIRANNLHAALGLHDPAGGYFQESGLVSLAAAALLCAAFAVRPAELVPRKGSSNEGALSR